MGRLCGRGGGFYCFKWNPNADAILSDDVAAALAGVLVVEIRHWSTRFLTGGYLRLRQRDVFLGVAIEDRVIDGYHAISVRHGEVVA